MTENDPVNHPKHYTMGKIEVADFIADQKLDFFLGNVVKYVCRCRWKGKMLEDLQKAKWYLNKAIEIELEKVVEENNKIAIGSLLKGNHPS